MARAIQLAERLQSEMTAGKAGRLTGLNVRSSSSKGRHRSSKVQGPPPSMTYPSRDGKDRSGQGLSAALALARSIHQRVAAEATAHQPPVETGEVRGGGQEAERLRIQGPCDPPSAPRFSEAASAVVSKGEREGEGPDVELLPHRVETRAVGVAGTTAGAADQVVDEGAEMPRLPSSASNAHEQELKQAGQKGEGPAKDRQAPPTQLTISAKPASPNLHIMENQGLPTSTDRPTRLRALRAQVDSLLYTHTSLLSPSAAQSDVGPGGEGRSTHFSPLPSLSTPSTDLPTIVEMEQASPVSLSTSPQPQLHSIPDSEAAKQTSNGEPEGGGNVATAGGAVADHQDPRGLCDAERELAELLSKIDMSGAGDDDGEMDGSEEWIDRALRVERELRAALGVLPGQQGQEGEVEGYMADLRAIRMRTKAATDALTQALSGVGEGERDGGEGGACACGAAGKEGGALEASVNGKRRRMEDRSRGIE